MERSSLKAGEERNYVFGSQDVLFGAIENQQGTKPLGDFLDAGTGLHSLRWIATHVTATSASQEDGSNDFDTATSSVSQRASSPLLTPSKIPIRSFTAITADLSMRRQVVDEAANLGLDLTSFSQSDYEEMQNNKNVKKRMDRSNYVVIGNWFPKSKHQKLYLPLPQYDTILADYLIGAMDGFSPYHQDEIIENLTKLLKPGGRLYIVGMEPIPDKSLAAKPHAENIICRVRQVRDACILLAGHRCYREYPMDWVVRQCGRVDNLKVIKTKQFPILYRHNTILRQINVARSKFNYITEPDLVASLKNVLSELEQESKEAIRASETGTIKMGFDYIVTVEKTGKTDDQTKEEEKEEIQPKVSDEDEEEYEV